MITINELFSGIGAQVAALKRLGIDHEVVGISEIDTAAIQSYERMNGCVRNYGDISKIEKLDYADLWTYSFPCQDLSVAGKKSGISEGTRSGLLLEVERLLEVAVKERTLPKYLLLENVKNLIGKKFKPDFDRWLNKLSELGYNNYWKVLNAKDYGVPQNRERVFVVSIRKDVDTHGYTFPEPFKLERRLKDVLETNVDEKFYLKQDLVKSFVERLSKRDISNTIRCGDSGSIDQKHTWDLVAEPSKMRIRKLTPKCCSGIIQLGNIVETDSFGGNPERGRVYDDKGISPCLSTMQGGGLEPKILKGYRIRKLTPKECWRLMGFTDEEFEAAQNSGVSNTQLYKQAGNSIVVDVLVAIFKNLNLEEIDV